MKPKRTVPARVLSRSTPSSPMQRRMSRHGHAHSALPLASPEPGIGAGVRPMRVSVLRRSANAGVRFPAWSPGCGPAWILGVALAIQTVALMIDWASLAHEQRTLRRQMESRFRAAFPDAVAVVDPV